MRFLVVVAMAAATAAGMTFTLVSCSPTTTIPVNVRPSSVACLQSPNGTVHLIVANGTHLDLSNQNITGVSAAPRDVTSIDLSSNNLGYVSLGDSVLETINLSDSQIASLTSVMLPATVETLDVSRNAITEFSVNWAILPKLASINVSSNLLARINKPIFPPSLHTLDLSKNLLYAVDLSVATYTQLSSATVTYALEPQMARVLASNCRDIGELRRLGPSVTGLVCVFDGDRRDMQNDMFVALRRLTILSLLLSGALILGYAALHWHRSRRANDDDDDLAMRGRETLTSSACEAYDHLPIQYRQSLTPVAAPQPATPTHPPRTN
ncbi:hypothetical protein H310_02409 [Aphanomyces invadans]|uniref:Uncharacterized protein n=1 Tax=Aphanomyces invadans TaxID=157072 RepID=A0A024UNL7_9STRA|nr:hypothetical protein H310_02409 [Aphanomyces invadans]ETW08036.1 hypothetical protein H310_02409 [Aphanomyces invadans]|eukprot:XP_008864129.1 hypothetical protein H310_02409 [Aphanomyces invadans]